jgi:hypothetical protein
MNLRMQGFDAAAHDLGEARIARHFHDGNAAACEQFRRAAGGEDLDALVYQVSCEFDEARLVRDGKKCAADRNVHLARKAELSQLLAQRPAIDAENTRGAHLIALGIVERGLQQRLFDLA